MLNNPLMYNDPNGEFFVFLGLGALFWKAVIIGAAVGLASYTVGLAVTGNLHQWNIGGALKATLWGGISGAVTFGIGNIFNAAATGALTTTGHAIKEAIGGVGLAMIQAGTHAVAQGVMSLMQGGSFEQAFWSGALGSLGASAFGAIAKDAAKSAVGTIAFGAVSGGIGAELSGGNFWQGAVIGGIVAGLNHAMHNGISEYDLGDNEGPGPKAKKTYTKEDIKREILNRHPYMNDEPIKMMGGPFDVFGLFEGAGIIVESYFSSKGLSTSGKVISTLIAAKSGKLKNNILTNTTRNGTTILKTSKNFRIDIDVKNGLHYHRRIINPSPRNTKPDGGIGRHRPWQSSPTDKSFWDRF